MDERIDIVIQDRISSSISTKIDGITRSARSAGTAVENLKKQLMALNSVSLVSLQRQLATITTTISRNALAQQKLATETARTTAALERARAATLAAELAALRLQQAQERAAQSSNRLSGSLSNVARSAAAVLGVGLSAHAIIELSDAYTVLQNKLRNVVDTEEQLTEVTNRVFDISNRTRSEVQATAQAFTRFDMAMVQLGASQEESLRLTETINKMIKISGATTNEAQSALLQLSQAFNKGKIDGDEFRTMMELMPAAADAIAKQMGVTRGELLRLAPEGKITAEIMRKAFAAVADEVDRKFGKTIPTINESLVVLRNSSTQFFGELNKALGITEGISRAILALSTNMKALALTMAVLGSAMLVVFGPALLSAIGAATGAIVAFGAALLANPIGLLIVGITSAIAVVSIFKEDIISVKDETTAWYYELTDLTNFIGQYFGAVLQDISKYFDEMTKSQEKFSLGTYLLKSAIQFLIDILKVVAIIASDVIFVFKMTGIEIGAIAAQLAALARLDFTGFAAISEAVREDAKKARKELDKFQADVMAFGTAPRIENQIKDINFAESLGLTEVKPSLRGPGKAAKLTDSKAEKEAEKRAMALGKINAELDSEIKGLSILKPQRDIQAKFDQIEINLASKKIKLNQQERNSILDKIKTIEQAKATQQAFDQIYESSVAPLRDYNAQIAAADKLLKMGAISAEFHGRSITMAQEAYNQALDPLYDFNRGLDQQFELLNKIGSAQEMSQQMQQLNNELLAKGIILNAGQTKEIEAKLKVLQEEKLISQELNKIYSETTGATKAIEVQTIALNKAYSDGILSLDQYNQRLIKLGLEAANLRIKLGEGSFNDVLTSSLGNMVSQYENVAASLTNTFGDFFTSFTDGFADSIGQAIVKSEDLGEALHNVANQAIAGLISSLVKLGVQYVVNAALGQSVGAAAMATQTAASVAAATTTAAAWAPAAAMVSLASFGANSAPAMVGIASTAALSQGIAMAGLAGFETGGFTGNVGKKQVAGVVHGQEFVVNAEATRRNRPMLEAINSGAKATSMNKSSSSSATNGAASINISIENHGTSKDFEVERLSENEIRVIARDEAKAIVRNEAPGVISASISNPNSVVSKSLNRNTQTQRRRD